jgi:hypothetical protein
MSRDKESAMLAFSARSVAAAPQRALVTRQGCCRPDHMILGQNGQHYGLASDDVVSHKSLRGLDCLPGGLASSRMLEARTHFKFHRHHFQACFWTRLVLMRNQDWKE